MSHRLLVAVITATAIAAASLVAAPAHACQEPPGSQVPCSLIPSKPVVIVGETFSFEFTITNYPATAPFPPPFLDDLDFEVEFTSPGRNPGTPPFQLECVHDPFFATPLLLDPERIDIQLDEAWSPFADEPTSHTEVVTATPESVEPTDTYYMAAASACAPDATGTCLRRCDVSAAVCVIQDPMELTYPHAEFLEPTQGGDAGASLPFRLRVLRNAYTPGVPLTVRVLPQNLSDPIDIFPIEPPSLTTTGYTVTGDDEIVDFVCSLHYPCFVGVDNRYRVTIHDGATLLWDSTLAIGRAHVTRSPMARQELVAIEDDGGDGALELDEHGLIHLRLYARNPFLNASLTDVVIETPIPAGLTVVSHELHHHDNPMDMVDPTPAELAATGAVTVEAGRIQVDTSELVARFTVPPFDPPEVFRDLFEVELVVETPPAGFAAAVDLVFPGVTVRGMSDGGVKSETSGPITIRVPGRRPPNAVELLVVKASSADVRLLWNDAAVDAAHDAAASYSTYRSEVIPGATAYDPLGDILDTTASQEEYLDAGALWTGPGLYYYRVSAFNADGDSSDVP